MISKNKGMVLGSVFFLLSSMGFLPSAYGCSLHGHGEKGAGYAGTAEKASCPVHGGATTEGKEKATKVGNKVCPVMGTAISEQAKVVHEHEGKLYNLCCPSCIDVFDEAPEKYIENISG